MGPFWAGYCPIRRRRRGTVVMTRRRDRSRTRTHPIDVWRCATLLHNATVSSQFQCPRQSVVSPGVVFMSGGITNDRHISMLGITELELGSSENSYSRARKRSVIDVLEVSGCHTSCVTGHSLNSVHILSVVFIFSKLLQLDLQHDLFAYM